MNFDNQQTCTIAGYKTKTCLTNAGAAILSFAISSMIFFIIGFVAIGLLREEYKSSLEGFKNLELTIAQERKLNKELSLKLEDLEATHSESGIASSEALIKVLESAKNLNQSISQGTPFKSEPYKSWHSKIIQQSEDNLFLTAQLFDEKSK